jgi:hypothetical protein
VKGACLALAKSARKPVLRRMMDWRVAIIAGINALLHHETQYYWE